MTVTREIVARPLRMWPQQPEVAAIELPLRPAVEPITLPATWTK